MSIFFLHFPLSLPNVQRISNTAASVATALASYMSAKRNKMKNNFNFLFRTMEERKAELKGRVVPKDSIIFVLFVCALVSYKIAWSAFGYRCSSSLSLLFPVSLLLGSLS